jgi:RNA polymerase sigma-70 factor (ECF subfamily)
MQAAQKKPEDDVAAERALVRAAKQGDLDAFETLVRRHSGIVFRVAFHISRCREDAEEIAQEAFLRAFQYLGTFEGRARVSTWLTRIAINVALSRTHSHRPQTVTIVNDGGDNEVGSEPIADWRPNPEQLYSRSELADILKQAIESLPATQSTVFWLRDVEGFSISETAETLGINQPAVKTRLLRARLQLREQLAQYFQPARAQSISSQINCGQLTR